MHNSNIISIFYKPINKSFMLIFDHKYAIEHHTYGFVTPAKIGFKYPHYHIPDFFIQFPTLFNFIIL